MHLVRLSACTIRADLRILSRKYKSPAVLKYYHQFLQVIVTVALFTTIISKSSSIISWRACWCSRLGIVNNPRPLSVYSISRIKLETSPGFVSEVKLPLVIHEALVTANLVAIWVFCTRIPYSLKNLFGILITISGSINQPFCYVDYHELGGFTLV